MPPRSAARTVASPATAASGSASPVTPAPTDGVMQLEAALAALEVRPEEEPRVREALDKLGVRTLRDLVLVKQEELDDATGLTPVTRRKLVDLWTRVQREQHAAVALCTAQRGLADDEDTTTPDVFLSYRVHDTGHVARGGDGSTLALKHALRARGFRVFVGEEDISGGDQWFTFIETALYTCAAFVPVCSPGYGASPWTLRELGMAVRLQKVIVPVFHSGTFPPRTGGIVLGGLQYVPSCQRGLVVDRISIEGTAAQLETALARRGVPHSLLRRRRNGDVVLQLPSAAAPAPAEDEEDGAASGVLRQLMTQFGDMSMSGGAGDSGGGAASGDSAATRAAATTHAAVQRSPHAAAAPAASEAEAERPYTKEALLRFPKFDELTAACQSAGSLAPVDAAVVWLTAAERRLRGDSKVLAEARRRELNFWLKSDAARKLRTEREP